MGGWIGLAWRIDIRDVRMGFDRRWLGINHRAVLLSLSNLVAIGLHRQVGFCSNGNWGYCFQFPKCLHLLVTWPDPFQATYLQSINVPSAPTPVFYYPLVPLDRCQPETTPPIQCPSRKPLNTPHSMHLDYTRLDYISPLKFTTSLLN
jgi:hypothetical protein